MAANKDDGGWKKFLWNSDTGELLGRTGGSWRECDPQNQLGFFFILLAARSSCGRAPLRLVLHPTCLI